MAKAISIKELRNLKRLTQKEFALKIGYGVRIVNYWENGVKRPLPKTIRLIEETFKVKLNY